MRTNIQYKIYNRQSKGFTLLEATMAMVVLVIAAAGVLLPFAGAASEQAEGARRTTAAQLASELMEKILVWDFDSIVSTYNGYSESTGNLLDAAGQKHTSAAYRGFSRYADCETVSAASVDLVSVTVVVRYDGAEMTRVTTLVGRN
jgi:prepilin-type N-terminal cleavage/methylation domain-containing protein